MNLNANLQEIANIFDEVIYFNLIKTGKEAEVHLLSVDGEYMALKLYRQQSHFASKSEYLGLREVGDARLRRAVRNRSRVGKATLQGMWQNREFTAMQQVSDAGADVPACIQSVSDGMLMEYVGDEVAPAPRLTDTKLTVTEAERALAAIIRNMRIFLQEGFVHGDLSAYNILWWQGNIKIIDFPQVVFIEKNRNWREKLNQDVRNIDSYFEKFDSSVMRELRYKLQAISH